MRAAGRLTARGSFSRRAPRQNVSRRATAARRRVWLGRWVSMFWAAIAAALVVFVGFFFIFIHDVLTQSEHFKARTIHVQRADGGPLKDVIKGAFPYVIIMTLFTLLLMAFPALVTWLPSQM